MTGLVGMAGTGVLGFVGVGFAGVGVLGVVDVVWGVCKVGLGVGVDSVGLGVGFSF